MRDALEQWGRDLRHAARSLRRSPGFAAVTIGTLALAIGANAAIFSVVDAVLIRPLPYAHGERLLFVAAVAPGSELQREFGLFDEAFVHYRERSRLIEDLALYNSFTNSLRVGDRVERVRMSMPSYTLFSTLGAAPLHGRLPRAEDENTAVILGVVGLYAALSYVVAERTREIGVRMALGAQPERVRRMVVLQGGQVVAAGVAAGLIAALFSTRALGRLLFGVEAFDLTIFAGVSAGMLLTGLMASYLPARRASSVDPIVSLRAE